MAKKFIPTDTVKLISGNGPNMGIENYAKKYPTKEYDYENYICVWFDEKNEPKSYTFHENVLELVKRA